MKPFLHVLPQFAMTCRFDWTEYKKASYTQLLPVDNYGVIERRSIHI